LSAKYELNIRVDDNATIKALLRRSGDRLKRLEADSERRCKACPGLLLALDAAIAEPESAVLWLAQFLTKK